LISNINYQVMEVPFCYDDNRKELTMKSVPILHPVPLVIVATKLENERINFTTIGDVAIAGLNPPLLMISLHERHLATKMIRQHNQFSVNLPLTTHIEKVKYCGYHSGFDYDKSDVFKSVMIDDVPVIEEMPVSMICTVKHEVIENNRVIFIVFVEQTLLREQLENIEVLLYGLDDEYYKARRI